MDNTPRQPAWGLLVYLAGDTDEWAESLRDDLNEILTAGGSSDLRIVVQYDGASGAVRHVVSSGPFCMPAVRDLGRVDSGSTAALLDFLQWGISVCDAERIALVLGSPLVVSPGDAMRDPDRVSVFSLTHDAGSGNYLDVTDMAAVIREALKDSGRSQLDLLAIDSCRAQFLELAYELEDIVHVLIAPQTEIPAAGWDYVRILSTWKEQAALRQHASTRDVALALLKETSECYRLADKICSVSALDLQRLDDVANAFDTMCIGTLQAIGEGLIWETRELLLRVLAGNAAQGDEKPASASASDDALDEGDQPVYDCGSFFAMWSAALTAMADESYQGWLGTTLRRSSGTRLDRFCEAVARRLEAALAVDGHDVANRILFLIDALRASPRETLADLFLKDLGVGVRRRITLLEPGTSPDLAKREADAADAREAIVKAAIQQSFHLLPRERQFDLQRMEEAADTARRLAAQSDAAIRALLGDASIEMGGLVIANRSMPVVDTGWPRWSGVSMYRPGQLDDLMNTAYTRFAFHRRVHWAALLGAANLIEKHPRALWRLVSSLLATGSAGTRRDVLRRLSGQDSVVWGLREQFQVMAPAPTLTLSLERRTEAPRENYILRLESVTRGAVITEQQSRVQPDTMQQALHELNRLLQSDVMTGQRLNDLRSIGGLLGEDIFQTLGSRLEDERRAVREETPDATPHLQLQIPRELMKYPWELLHHHGEWLGERYAMGRQVFMETGLARRVPGRRQGRVRPLVIGDPVLDFPNWRQLPGARAEAEQVAGWFASNAARAGSVIDFDLARDTRIHCRLTRAELRALLREGRYDIVHFAGHGLFRADDPETSAWILSDGELWSLEIRNTLADHPSPPWLVFANACEAGMDAARPNRGYHDNVFGLATAFINQGVAAYIAPLWPIDDLLAQYIALGFYRELLCERATLGEALRRAKAAARVRAYPEESVRNGDRDQAWASLGWASLVLYGDPTEELFQALAGGSHQGSTAETAAAYRQPSTDRTPGVKTPGGGPSSRLTKAIAAMPVLHAPDHVVTQWVRGPKWRDATSDSRGIDSNPLDGEIALDLIEEAGLRRWRVRNGQSGTTRGAGAAGDGLPGSQIAKLLADERVRAVLPSKRGITRVVGRWIVSGLKDGVCGLVKEYDREQVKEEGLLVLNGATSASLAPASRARAGGTASRSHRALVLVHGTFSKTSSPVDGFGPSFIEWARQNYRVVLGFDHWTLSKSPDENASLLANELRAFDSELMTGGRIDLVTHSRGGLVARAFCLDHADAVRNLIFLGTPNCGTDLANPQNWGSFADLLVNMTGIDAAELFGRMAGLLAQLAAAGVVSDVPGLLAQSPEAAVTDGSFLNRLQKASIDPRIKYGVVCSEFEPATLVPNLKKIVKAAADASLDVAVDALFAGANDLVVNTPYAWGIGRGPKELTSLPQFLQKDRVLVYRPPGVNGTDGFAPPDGVLTEEALGIHHCNLFGQRRVQEALRAWLTES
jgi:CHAT domain-containing protein/pimeloyl-ACP methyl ester carboxylesterase